MKIKKYIIVAVTIILLGGAYWFYSKNQTPKMTQNGDPKNMTYKFSGIPVTLANGYAESSPAEGTYSKTKTRYFGNRIKKDLDGDGREDQAFLLTQERGGSGVFFYVAAVLNTPNGYVGSNAMLIGDRISPQTTESGPGRQIVVNYADRKPGEPFTTPPSVGKSMYLLFDTKSMQFGEVVRGFEGESNLPMGE